MKDSESKKDFQQTEKMSFGPEAFCPPRKSGRKKKNKKK